MARLVLNPGTEGTQTFDLQPGIQFVGRRPDNDICIPDASVSGQHCRLTIGENSVTLTDLDSTNGTFVEGNPVKETELLHGQTLRFGSMILRFEHEDTATTQAPPPPAPAHPPRVRVRVATGQAGTEADQTLILKREPPVQTNAPPAAPTAAANCKYHPRSPARWHCPKCGKSFCDMCVSTRATAHGSAHLCRTCGVEVAPLKVELKRPVKPRFSKVMWTSFGYPFSKDGLMALVVGSVLFAIMSVASKFSFWITILFYGYFFSYLQNVIHATSMGESQVEWPTPTDFISEIIVPAFQVFVCVVVSFGPAIGLFIWGAANENPAVLIGGIVALVYGCLYFPMAFLAVAMFDSVGAVNPVLVIPSIGRVFGKYLIACIVLGIVFAVSEGISIGLALLIPMPLIPDAIASMFSLYFLLVECRILGLLYWTNSRRLGWFEKQRR